MLIPRFYKLPMLCNTWEEPNFCDVQWCALFPTPLTARILLTYEQRDRVLHLSCLLCLRFYLFRVGNLQSESTFSLAFHASLIWSKCFCSYVWLSLVSHRSFMPRLLTGNAQKGWPYIQRLLVDLFQFLEPYLRNAELSSPVCHFYLLVCSSL